MTINPEQQGVPTEVAESEYVLSLKPILRIFWRRLWLIILMGIVCAGAAYGYASTQEPQYSASSKVLVGQEGQVTTDPSDVVGLQSMTLTMAEAANSRLVAEEAVQEYGLDLSTDSLLSGMSVEEVPETQFIEISYTGSDPETATEAANALGKAFSDRLEEMASSNNDAITATVWDEAAGPETPVSPTPERDGALGLMAGIFIGVALAFLLEYLDSSWRSREEAEQITGAPSFGVVPKFSARNGVRGGSS